MMALDLVRGMDDTRPYFLWRMAVEPQAWALWRDSLRALRVTDAAKDTAVMVVRALLA